MTKTHDVSTTLQTSQPASSQEEKAEFLSQLQSEDLQFNDKGTLLDFPKSKTAPPLTWENLPRFAIRESEETDSQKNYVELELRQLLGEGGMGVVQLALQVPLQREVAVKRLRKERQNSRRRMALLREAWITGTLEHPNIIPIHALGSYKDGSPMLVMKKVEGVVWSELMHNPDHPLRQGKGNDELVWNLDVLMQVCNAVHFAHSRGILHRDLKPDNVMIGAFGEVYLLDWGIAISLHDHDPRPIPKVSEIASVAGTPGYMAPEMAQVNRENVSERTDVYQLGAILHQILTRQPRNIGGEVMEVLFRTTVSAPFEYNDDVPVELARLCNQATHVEPAKRPASAEKFRQALAHFLEHRDSVRLTGKAKQTLQELRKQVHQPPEDSSEDRRLQVYGLFSECRFGFEQALQVWDLNMDARAGLEEARELITSFELQQGDYKSASLFFNTLQAPAPALQEALETLRLREESKQQELQFLQNARHDVDLSVNHGSRSLLALLFGLAFFPLFLVHGRWLQWMEFNWLSLGLFSVAFVGMTLVASIWGYTKMEMNRINRGILGSFWVTSLLLSSLAFGGWWLELPVRKVFSFSFVVFSLQTGLFATLIAPGFFAASGFFLVTFFLILFFPSWLFEIGGLGCSLAVTAMAIAWRPEQETTTFFHESNPADTHVSPTSEPRIRS